MEYFEKDLGKILKRGALGLRRVFNQTRTDCGRVYDRNLEQYPVTIDLYGPYAKITDYSADGLSDEAAAEVEDIARRMLYIEKGRVVFQRRAKMGRGEQRGKQGGEPVLANVQENGHIFKVDLSSHVDTGLFLDQANNRKMVEEESGGKDVLNLFSHTGSFSVYAAAGGARTVTSVDLSNTYTVWARENLKANGFEGDPYRCLAMDAEAFVRGALENGDRYDIIIFDPPSFSNSRKMKGDFDVQRDHAYWLARLFKLLRKDGWILFSTNLGSFQMDAGFKSRSGIREITASVKAEGFSRGVGASRSWILEKDDESLKARWEDRPAKRPGAAKERDRGGSFDRGFGREQERRSDRSGGRNEWRGPDRPSWRDRDDRGDDRRDFRRDRDDRRSFDRGGEDRPRRRYDDDRPPRRSWDDRPPRRDWDGRPDYRRDRDRDGDRDWDDRRDFRRDRDDRRSFDRGGEDRPRRRFDDDRRDFPRRDRDDRRPFDRGGEDRPRRRFDDDRRDFPRRDRDDRPPRRDRDDRQPRRESKPYGYDDFAPTRDRNDSERFFWLDEDKPASKKEAEDIETTAKAEGISQAAAPETRPEAEQAAKTAPEAQAAPEAEPRSAKEAAPETEPRSAQEAAPETEPRSAQEAAPEAPEAAPEAAEETDD